jgi:REP element-mobilizing transposase RayT
MARPLRIEFPGAVYHVTSRGDRREPIFVNDHDRHGFLDVVAQALSRFDAEILAYYLMGNHYHLVLHTRKANLSLLMRHINGVYTQAFNRQHNKVGHLFQGRFKAILVDRDAYLLEVCLCCVDAIGRTSDRTSVISKIKFNKTQVRGQALPFAPSLQSCPMIERRRISRESPAPGAHEKWPDHKRHRQGARPLCLPRQSSDRAGGEGKRQDLILCFCSFQKCSLQIRAVPFHASCFTSAYRRVCETGKSPWHFIFVQVAFTAIVFHIDLDSVSSIAGGNHEYTIAAETEVARTRFTIASILAPSTHSIERLGSKRPISVPVTLPNEMNAGY